MKVEINNFNTAILHEKLTLPCFKHPIMKNAPSIYLTSEIRQMEKMAFALPDPPNLMEKAGYAAAQITADKLLSETKSRVLVLAGPGNNGGDAFVVARYLKQWKFQITLIFTGHRDKLSADAKQALDAYSTLGDDILNEIPKNTYWDAVIDGIFGIGLDQNKDRPLNEKYLSIIKSANDLNVPIVALDIPSGLGSDNGCIQQAAIHATYTTTFIGFKPGLFTNDGPDHCGEVLLCDLELNPPRLLTPHTWLIDQSSIQQLLPSPRHANSHKGTYGSIGLIGGSTSMTGAVLLAGKAALKLGTGRVYLGLTGRDAPVVDMTQPELMLRSPHDLFKLENINCLVVGPGLGLEPDSHTWVDSALNTHHPLVLDADALNHIATYTHLANKLQQRKAPSILTPHATEAARLLDTDTKKIQSDRMAASLKLANAFNCYIVLKGTGSICATPDGHRYINTSGNPGLSSAGTGDVLSGMIGALLAQGLEIKNALLLATYLHGAAADTLLQQNNGPLGMTASEIISPARQLLNSWIYKS